MQKIQLNLEVTAINQILSALGNQPYAEVFTLITSIQQQAAAQLQGPKDNSTEIADPVSAE
jgi:hypothetical protein